MKSTANKLSLVFLTAALLGGALLASGCGTMFGVRMTSPVSWLEGKDYVVQFSMANTEKARKVTLYYRVNDGPYQAVEPQRAGSLREYLIPGVELVPGRLDYYVIVLDADGKEHKEGVRAVTILSVAEGKAQAERDLARRVRVTAPTEIGVVDDFALALSVAQPLREVAVTLHLRDATSSAYQDRPLDPTGGEYRYHIAAIDLREGELDYFFTIAEEHPDFGRLEISYPAEAEAGPLVTRVLGLNEMANRMARELVASVIHNPPTEALETADLTITLGLDVMGTSMLRARLLSAPGVLLLFAPRGRAARYRSLPMTPDGSGNYTTVITRRELAAGVNSYFFTISVNTRDVGMIDVSYPAEAERAPFVYRIVNLKEMRARLEREYAAKFDHTPPERASQLEPLELALTIAPDARAANDAVLHYQADFRGRYRDLAMRRSGNSFTVDIPGASLPDNRIVYYFTVTLSFPNVGEISVDVPGEGANRPFSVPVEGRNAAEFRLKADLARRVHHVPVTEAQTGEDLEVSLTIDAMKAGTRATLYIKQPAARNPITKKMTGRGNRLSAVIGGNELKPGNCQYYIEIDEPHPALRVVSITLPAAAPARPYNFVVKQAVPPQPSPHPSPSPSTQPSPQPPETPVSITAADVDFTPVTQARAGKALKLKFQIKHPPEGLTVTFAWRIKDGRGNYQTVNTSQSGNNFFAEIDRSAMIAGRVIEYYFVITPRGGTGEFRYPAADKPPFSLTVSARGGGNRGN
ncbi:MAG: hypothetical protein JXD23_09990 [Spirochaetales bacterium]|nr:hypothetical protein [Spirochaetales bacterium]